MAESNCNGGLVRPFGLLEQSTLRGVRTRAGAWECGGRGGVGRNWAALWVLGGEEVSDVSRELWGWDHALELMGEREEVEFRGCNTLWWLLMESVHCRRVREIRHGPDLVPTPESPLLL